ncbi:MAG: hypothetical protein LBR16_00495 [Treponema sp.]|jgi:hypothetical protein|nr:hypothetical protein [Treponema sp.]
MTGPILVVLAAGMGSRYGGLKQMDKLGSSGETLLDYSVFDARRAGFEKVVFIIREYMKDDFLSQVTDRMKGLRFDLAFQELDRLVPPDVFAAFEQAGRTKPWGTAHALLCAADFIDAPFCVINSDDFYSREAFAAMGPFLQKQPVSEGAIVPYALEKTLSPLGTVTRGICGIEGDRLVSVEELLNIEKKDGAIFNTEPDGSKRPLAPDTPVSMNFWGFPQRILADFRAYFNDFIAEAAGDPAKNLKAECYIPRAADHFIRSGAITIRSLPAKADWFGVTYKEDKGTAIARLRALVDAGVYPERLWG